MWPLTTILYIIIIIMQVNETEYSIEIENNAKFFRPQLEPYHFFKFEVSNRLWLQITKTITYGAKIFMYLYITTR